MNKVPWFTHDNMARHDLELRGAMHCHGALRTYGLWWMLVEILDAHGHGNRVEISWRDLEKDSSSKRTLMEGIVRAFAGKCPSRCVRKPLLNSVELSDRGISFEIERFRERAAKRRYAMKKSDPASAESSAGAAYLQAWNDFAGRTGLPTLKELSPSRLRRLEALGADRFSAVLLAAAEQPFLLGIVDPPDEDAWKIDLDWLLKSEENIDKVLANTYRVKPTRAGKRAAVVDPYAEAREVQAKEAAVKAQKAAKPAPAESDLEDVPF